jgi:hypothetical protein
MGKKLGHNKSNADFIDHFLGDFLEELFNESKEIGTKLFNISFPIK